MSIPNLHELISLQVFKEEEEAIKVDLHEGCGRTKLFWVMALTDSKTLKSLVEFRDGAKKLGGSTGGGAGSCRFCGSSAIAGLTAAGNVCSDPDCQVIMLHAIIHVCTSIMLAYRY